MRFLLTGPFACFRRFELRRDLVSYPVCTPYAATNVLRAAWPAAKLRVRSIEPLRTIRFVSRRDMLSDDRRVVLLEDVAYLIDADGVGVETGDLDHHAVHLGLSDLEGRIRIVPDDEEVPSTLPAGDGDARLGLLPYDLWGEPRRPRFFEARLKDGVLHVPPRNRATLFA